MKTIKIILFNLILIFLFLLIAEFIIVNIARDENEEKFLNIYIPTYSKHIHKVSYLEKPRFYYKYEGKENIKNPPIMLIGCSYAYGHGLRYKKTFAAKLSKIMKRDIYNFAHIGQGPTDILLSLDYSKHLSEIKTEPEYVIYLYMYHHPDRIKFNFENVLYLQENNILLSKEKSILKKTYIYKNFQKQKLEKKTIKSKDEKWKYEYIKDSILKMHEKIQKRFPKAKFIVLVYSDYERYLNQNILKYKGLIDGKEYEGISESTMRKVNYDILHSKTFWNEIQEKGIIIIKTEDLLGRTMNKPEERLNPDFAITIHPSEYAWDELTPLIAKELKKY